MTGVFCRNRPGAEEEPTGIRLESGWKQTGKRVGGDWEPTWNRLGTEEEPTANRLGSNCELTTGAYWESVFWDMKGGGVGKGGGG